MNEKQLRLVTFEQAVKLKELGFDWRCDKFYTRNGNWNLLPAPTVALALKWFRDVKETICYVYFDFEKINWRFGICNSMLEKAESIDMFDTYEASEIALLDELILLQMQ